MRARLQGIDYIGLILLLLRTVIIVLILWGTIASLLNNPLSCWQWFDLLVFGIVKGSLYALIAVGYTLVYDMLSVINFAHGEFFMSGVLTATIFCAVPMNDSGLLARQPFLGLLIITMVAMAVSVLIAVSTERIAYRPLRKAPRLMLSIAALGASIFWRSFFRSLYGPEVKVFPQVPILLGTIPLFGTELMKSNLIVITISGLLFLGLSFFITHTKLGKVIRAAAENKDAAVLMGVNTGHTITATFAMGAAIAGVAGVLYALVYGKAHFYMGFSPGIKAFSAAVLGGIGSIPGALVGGIILGIIESVGPSLFLAGLGIPTPYQLTDIIGFAMLILILILRPQGIMRRQPVMPS